ncbi:MAG TPA: hypothetical protein VGQ09_05030 [Chitinophagaceae bacterium]|jgi:hypothetical protein|nr:hypothetical protein [Chitinophagaceae bacterium]
MNKKIFIKVCLYLIVIALTSCNKANYFPDLGAEWKNLASPVPDNFYFRANDGSAYKSEFVGNESLSYSDVYSFSGSYENHKIHFTFSSGPNAGTTYSGTISGTGKDEIIMLSTPTGQITLTR